MAKGEAMGCGGRTGTGEEVGPDDGRTGTCEEVVGPALTGQVMGPALKWISCELFSLYDLVPFKLEIRSNVSIALSDSV
ncbi:hypothetical protein TRIUR3_20724 [Triticum urartu]|uniref:Uncharacterized protein n=1 Tax=Triticum urartu TaxID=4572 RepID=M8B562_TRIUA|nr:hypothetical protein TRIUR3_20724 [Triticum urartu]